MSQEKSTYGTGRGAPVEDVAQIRQAMLDLFRMEAEFPIRVEGAHSLPYTAKIHRVDPEKGLLVLKLIRPLPHEMAPGAPFEMLFSLEEQRFEAPTVFQGREGYLLYGFTLPAQMIPSDRRQHKRYPFRPREKAYVVAQDGSIPGHGLSGPLVNLSLGGLAFRVDRVMRLDDHMRVTPGLGFFERGKAFPMLKIRDLPKLPIFEARGVLVNAWERDGEIIVDIQFGELQEAELREIQGVLELRENMQRASSGTASDGARDSGPRSPAASKGPAARVAPAGKETPDALRRLGRRCTRLVLVMVAGPEREQVRQALGTAGFLRLETVDTLPQALASLRADRSATNPLLVFEPPPGESLSLLDIQTFQQELGELRELPVALIVRGDSVRETGDSLIRPMPWPTSGDLSWSPLLDELAGL